MASEDDDLHLSCESSDFEEDESLPKDASKELGLQPYQFEPYAAENRSTDDSSDQEETVDSENGSRLDCNEWCQCGNCASMATFRECVCCKEIAPMAAMIESMSVPCIIQHPGFRTVCLDIYVLQTAYYHYRQQYHHQIQDTNNRYRYTAYRQLTRFVWGYLRKEIRVILPACAVTEIRKNFPSADGSYTGYLEAD